MESEQTVQNANVNAILQTNEAQIICDRLQDYVTTRRKERIQQMIERRLHSIQAVLESPYDPHNAAAVVRNCEGFGVLNLDIIDTYHNAIKSPGVTQGAFHWLNIRAHDSLEDYLSRKSNTLLLGAVMDGEYALQDVPIDKPVSVILGNEHAGLSDAALQACDLTYRIPMYGMSESFNLSVSAGISLYELTKKRRKFLDRDGDLTDEQATRLRARAYLKTVDERLAVNLFLKQE